MFFKGWYVRVIFVLKEAGFDFWRETFKTERFIFFICKINCYFFCLLFLTEITFNIFWNVK